MSQPDLLDRGIVAFNNREYSASRNLFEELWHGPTNEYRKLAQALIQASIGCGRAATGNWASAGDHLARACRCLAMVPNAFAGIDVHQFAAGLGSLAEAVAARVASLDNRPIEPASIPTIGHIDGDA